MRLDRIAGIAGIVFVVMLIANAVLLGNQPLPSDDVLEIREYILEDEEAHKTAMLFAFGATPFAIFFLAGVVARVRSGGGDEGWDLVALLSAAVLVAGAGVGHVLLSALFFRGGSGLNDPTFQALYHGSAIAYAATGVAVAALTTSVALSARSQPRWPQWHAALGLLVAALGLLALVGTVQATSAGAALAIIGFIGFAVWTLATSIVMMRATT